jgi:hypothetical protein
VKTFAIAAAALATTLAAGTVHAQSPANPYAYTCGTYLEAQQSGERGQANAILYWATGYLQARLGALPTTAFTAESFGQGIQDVHATLMRICPNVPQMAVAEFMSNLASDFEKSAKSK